MRNRTDYSKKYKDNVTKNETAEIKSVEENNSREEKNLVRVKVSRLNLRTDPSTNFDPIAELTEGSELMVLRDFGDWHQVMTASGLEGYVLKEFVS